MAVGGGEHCHFLPCLPLRKEGKLSSAFSSFETRRSFVLVCLGLRSQMATNWRLKAVEMYCLTAPDARSLRSRCWPGWFLLEALGDHVLYASLCWVWWRPPSSGTSSACRRTRPVSVFVFTRPPPWASSSSFCPPCNKDTCHWLWGPP